MKNNRIGLLIIFNSKIDKAPLNKKYTTYECSLDYSFKRILIQTNSKYELKMWMDLNGFKLGKPLLNKHYRKKVEFKKYVGKPYELVHE